MPHMRLARFTILPELELFDLRRQTSLRREKHPPLRFVHAVRQSLARCMIAVR